MSGINFFTLTLLLLICKGSALVCNVCESFESWDDCEDSRIIVDCSSVDPEFDVCLKAHRATKINDSEIHMYTKRCGYQELCNGEQCKEFGDWCQVDCCNMDMCNVSPPVRVTYTTYLLLGTLTAFSFGQRIIPLWMR